MVSTFISVFLSVAFANNAPIEMPEDDQIKNQLQQDCGHGNLTSMADCEKLMKKDEGKAGEFLFQQQSPGAQTGQDI